jgi:low affinity Fe/Cu permease
MLFYAFYVIAIIVLILHFSGWLKRYNLEWLVLVLAVATFPAVIFLK